MAYFVYKHFYNTHWAQETVQRQFQHFPSRPVLPQSQINIPVQFFSPYSAIRVQDILYRLDVLAVWESSL